MNPRLPVWVLPSLLVLTMLIAIVVTERQRRVSQSPTGTPQVVNIAAFELSDVALGAYSMHPLPLGVRYPHRQLARASGGAVAAVFALSDPPRIALVESPAMQRVLLPSTRNDPSLPTIALTQDSSGASTYWIAMLEQIGAQTYPRLYRGPALDQLERYALPDTYLISFPSLTAYENHLVMSGLEIDALGVSSISLMVLEGDVHRVTHRINHTSAWQTLQPPDVRLIGTQLTVVARGETPPRMRGTIREVDSGALAWRFDLTGHPPGDPEILMPAQTGQFTERPVLASDRDGNLAVAIGHWGPPQAEGLRGYDLAVLLAEGQGPWHPANAPLTGLVSIATAQPQLARDGAALLLVYALDANEIELQEAHRLQWVRSLDAGVTWAAPPLALTLAISEALDFPLDLLIEEDHAWLLYQRQTPVDSQSRSIVVQPPRIEERHVSWKWKVP